jgi:TetR/AcrR family transcriptional regulator, transcriptional repressor for nem operon
MQGPKRQRDPDRTRERLLDAGFREIHRQGFQPASLDTIVDAAGVTKGALYHHFANKRALGYAVVDEVVAGLLLQRWLEPLEGAADPIDALIAAVRAAAVADQCELGCPLNNLAQEMSATDKGFQRRIDRLYRRWEAGFAEALERGQRDGKVRPDVDVAAAATFLVASIEGALGLAKNRKDPQPLHACLEGVARYLSTLRATTGDVAPASRGRARSVGG